MSGILYVVGTPIGNLGDMSPRAVETLENVDFIAAEDTRVTLKLLNHFGIKKPMVSYFEHNKHQRGEIICRRILSGENCAIVTDAGMPCISDPGELLVKQCEKYGIEVKAVPGPSAVISALAISGLPTGRFTFEGFLSVNKPSRREHLQEIVSERRTMVFYEAPHKLTATLKDLYKYLGDRRIALIKELTKIHETVERTTLSEACEKYSAQTPKGEFVIVIEGSTEPKQKEVSLDEAVALAKGLVENGMAINDAAKEIAKETKLKKGDIYKALLCE